MGSNNSDMYFNNSPSNPFLKVSMSLWQQSAGSNDRNVERICDLLTKSE